MPRGPSYHARTHLPGGTDPIPMLPTPSGPGLFAAIVTDPGLFAFWPFNETSGTVAHDAGPNGLDLTVSVGTPTWGAAAGPPGETTVQLDGSTSFGRTGFASLTAGDATAEMWVMDTHATVATASIYNQGLILSGNNPGWTLVNLNNSGNPQPAVYADFTGSTEVNLVAAVRAQNVWYHYACTKASNVWRLYVNGVQDPVTTMTQAGGVIDLLSVGGGFTGLTGRLSYGAVYTRALSGAEILDHYTRASTGGNELAGKVWTSDGAGSASWEFPTIETRVNGA